MIHVGWRYRENGNWVYIDGTVEPDIPNAEKVFTEVSEVDINEALLSRGMFSVAELLGGNLPTDYYRISRDIVDYKTFDKWLDTKVREYTMMRLKYETGFEKEDSMYEWVFAHSAVYKDISLNWKKIYNKTNQSP